jgi:hypothetical protein
MTGAERRACDAFRRIRKLCWIRTDEEPRELQSLLRQLESDETLIDARLETN